MGAWLADLLNFEVTENKGDEGTGDYRQAYLRLVLCYKPLVQECIDLAEGTRRANKEKLLPKLLLLSGSSK